MLGHDRVKARVELQGPNEDRDLCLDWNSIFRSIEQKARLEIQRIEEQFGIVLVIT